MRRVNLKPIGDFVGQVCEIALYGVMILASYKVSEYITKEHDNAPVGYNDAVDAIMDSAMFSGDKHKAISMLKHDGNAEFYRAVVRVMKDSSMFSGDKLKMIQTLSEK